MRIMLGDLSARGTLLGVDIIFEGCGRREN